MNLSFHNIIALVGLPILGLVCLWVSASKDRDKEERVASFVIALFCFGAFAFICVYAGHGYAQDRVETLSGLLSNGHAYEVVAVRQDGKDKVLTIMGEKKSARGTHNFYILRVQGPVPPRYFQMDRGEPVAYLPSTQSQLTY